MHGRFNPTATLFPLMVAGLLAGLTYWLDLASRPPEIGVDGKSRHDPDYIVERFEVRRFDPAGKLQHTLRASSMRHFPDDDSTSIESPHLTYHHQPPGILDAREARILGKGKHVRLLGNVRATRAGIDGRPATVLTTESLDVFPDEEVARTNAPVTIVQGRSQVDGSGLNANHASNIYVIDGPVRGIFQRGDGARSRR